MSNSSEKITRVISARRRATRWPVCRIDVVEAVTTVAVFGSRASISEVIKNIHAAGGTTQVVSFLAPWMVGRDMEAAFSDGRKVVVVNRRKTNAGPMKVSFVASEKDFGHLWTRGRLPQGTLHERLVDALGLANDVSIIHDGYWNTVGRRPH